ncbi:transposase [Saccharothrix lopnurensis]|uniref:Transposase n=1 Tax=Saccharothrix lopnurensis TaxID=1670621 RepID=A0ABW1P5P8_9PSEU
MSPILVRRQTPRGSGLGTLRRVVERGISRLRQFRRLRIRWERRTDVHEAVLELACALICCRRLRSF